MVFPTITMPDHHYTNGGALAFQGASIKEAKKSCSQRGEIHFVPGSNICCSHRSQKDAGIKPESPLIYCNDRQIDRRREDGHMQERGRRRKRQKQLLSRCLSRSDARYVHVSVGGGGGVMGTAGWQIPLRWVKSQKKEPVKPARTKGGRRLWWWWWKELQKVVCSAPRAADGQRGKGLIPAPSVLLSYTVQ